MIDVVVVQEKAKSGLDELCIDHVLWSFEQDEEGYVKRFPLVFRFQNMMSDHSLWCGINPESGECDAYSCS